MQARELTLRKLLDGQRQYQLPLFQRPYSWTPQQQTQLWRDVIELHEVQDANAQHFLGSVVTSPVKSGPDRPEMFVLVDGQQRLTTLAVLISALRDAMKESDATAAE